MSENHRGGRWRGRGTGPRSSNYNWRGGMNSDRSGPRGRHGGRSPRGGTGGPRGDARGRGGIRGGAGGQQANPRRVICSHCR